MIHTFPMVLGFGKKKLARIPKQAVRIMCRCLALSMNKTKPLRHCSNRHGTFSYYRENLVFMAVLYPAQQLNFELEYSLTSVSGSGLRRKT